ncbi:hypothetical protein [Chryseolinea lacunae]|uniref:Lipoprotein n=1 Tax=Chryseolinea lacunae TaxID=2801331 RepID=A0ABS1KXM6_9BACT|nr:hypothetical protein [Chryseolinea lacunae]MBL0744124.1 hypothetical protein [Chryseolinea lacunae]
MNAVCFSISLRRVVAVGLFTLLCACGGLPKAEKVYIVVRESPNTLLRQRASVAYFNGKDTVHAFTNPFGFLVITQDSLVKGKMSFERLKVTARYRNPASGVTKSAAIALNAFSEFYDLYLDPVAKGDSTTRVADMHYHVSMRPYNAFGNDIYNDLFNNTVPTNLNWLRVENKLCVFKNGKWKKFSFNNSILRDTARLRIFLERQWVRSKDGANNLKHFSEATFPHMAEGNVYLAFNAISPFEHGLANEGVKRAVSSGLKSGADIDWLNMMGKDPHISHWANFQHEYKMITSQDTLFDNYHWSTLERKQNLNRKLARSAVVVNVVEGGHILQDKYFPHAINFDITDTTSKQKQDLFGEILATAKAQTGSEDKAIVARFERYQAASRAKKDSLIDDVLMNEVLHNVDSLKKMNVHMIAISHLSYNGMTGHAPALDVSKKPWLENFTSYLAKRAFGIRASNDRKYQKSFDGLFFRVPGVNKFGDTVITRLLHTGKDTAFVHIDLKHSDVLTRRFVLDKYERASLTLPNELHPICSHCAVNGLSIDYTSPLLNEYSLLKSSLARKFYPFAINLYNEEVARICKREGIIGVPLEERVLGGYIDNRQQWSVCIRRKRGRYTLAAEGERARRFKYTRKAIAYLGQHTTPGTAQYSQEFVDAKAYYTSIMKAVGADDKTVMRTLCEDYLSAEPFLQNVFHIVDIAYKTKHQQRLDSLLNVANTKVKIKAHATLGEAAVVKQKEATEKAKRGLSPTDNVSNEARKLRMEIIQHVADTVLQQSERQSEYQAQLSAEIKNIKDSVSTLALDPVAIERQIKRSGWVNICLGSDLDGMIDPINICPTASQYPAFKAKLKVLIPLFIAIRHQFEVKDKLLPDPYPSTDYYFNANFKVDEALDMLFYTNLKDFTLTNFVL